MSEAESAMTALIDLMARLRDPKTGSISSDCRRRSATYSRYFRRSCGLMPATPRDRTSCAKADSQSTASRTMAITSASRAASKSSGSSRRAVAITLKANAMCALSSRKTQFVPVASPWSSPFDLRKYT